jgi:hypothetical protein
MKTATLALRIVEEMPRTFEPGTLFVSHRFKVAGHLCACGCGNKVVVPLGNPGYQFTERAGQGTLRPSIGSWQLPCQSHYYITDGRIEWRGAWSSAQIESGRRAEQQRLEAYYRDRARNRLSLIGRLVKWFKSLFG